MNLYTPYNFSFELFPPKTPEGFLKLENVCSELQTFYPLFFSVTFGAAGATQLNTLTLVRGLARKNLTVTPHISCVDMKKERLALILSEYIQLGICRLVVIQGDLSDQTQASDFNYAHELIAYIRKISGDHFQIFIAAYPEYHPRAKTPTQDLENFQRKIDAGANAAITQFFFNSDAYCCFKETCQKRRISIPLIPGIMPIQDYTKLLRFSTSCGAEIPLWLRKQLETVADNTENIKEIGVDVVSKLCEKLLAEGAPGLHFYTLNQLEPTVQILKRLGVKETTHHRDHAEAL